MSEIDNSASETPVEAETATAPAPEAKPTVPPEDISYHAVEKDGQVTALWEMQGRKHIRTIDPRSREGLAILQHYSSDHHDEPAAEPAAEPVAEAAAESTAG